MSCAFLLFLHIHAIARGVPRDLGSDLAVCRPLYVASSIARPSAPMPQALPEEPALCSLLWIVAASNVVSFTAILGAYRLAALSVGAIATEATSSDRAAAIAALIPILLPRALLVIDSGFNSLKYAPHDATCLVVPVLRISNSLPSRRIDAFELFFRLGSCLERLRKLLFKRGVGLGELRGLLALATGEDA